MFSKIIPGYKTIREIKQVIYDKIIYKGQFIKLLNIVVIQSLKRDRLRAKKCVLYLILKQNPSVIKVVVEVLFVVN